MLPWPNFPNGLRLETEDLDAVLSRYGVSTLIRRATSCPCLSPETRRPDPTCSKCRGWGWQYPQSLELTLPVQWAGNDQRREQKEGGTVEPGDFVVTWPSTQPLGQGDLFVNPMEEAVTDETLMRGHIDPTSSSMERLRFRLPTNIEDLRDELRTYSQGVDFELGPDGRTVIWLDDGRSPLNGSMYAVRYRYRAEYAVAPKLPMVRHDGNQRLPFKASVVRYDPLSIQAGMNLGEST
jgi:hypothetical protein